MRKAFRNSKPGKAARRGIIFCGLLCSMYFMGGRGGAWAGDTAQPAQPLSADTEPPILAHVSFTPRLNANIPLNLQFRDESGKTVALSDYARGKPIILTLMYYTCPTLCDEVVEGLAIGLRPLSFDAGKDFQVVAVSINPAETPADALSKKQDAIARYHHANTDAGWHFLTGNQNSIAALADAANFHYTYDPGTKTFAHASGILILTPQGRVSRYLYGIEYEPRELKLALMDASADKIGTVVDHLLLYCYLYDPATAKYGAAIARLLFWFGLATVAALASLIIFLFRRGSNTASRSKQVESTL